MSEIDISIDRLVIDVESSTLKTNHTPSVSSVGLESRSRSLTLNGLRSSVSVESVIRSIDVTKNVQEIELTQFDVDFRGPIRELLITLSPDSGNIIENRSNGLFATPQWGSAEW